LTPCGIRNAKPKTKSHAAIAKLAHQASSSTTIREILSPIVAHYTLSLTFNPFYYLKAAMFGIGKSPSNASGDKSSNFYFVQKSTTEGGNERQFSEIESVPAGTSEDEFAPRLLPPQVSFVWVFPVVT
jgi:hypothetical protein